MAKLADAAFAGASAKKYTFGVYPIGTSFKALGGDYVITRRTVDQDGHGSHFIIYIGQTGDLSTRFDNHHKAQCFKNNNANCICVLLESGEKARLAIETDLCRANEDAPCND